MPDPDIELDRRLAAAVADWSLHDLRVLADTPTSRVFRAIARGDEALVLKLLKPYGFDELPGAELMEWYGGEGAARIVDIRGHAILMEWLDGPPLGDMIRADNGRDDAATAMLCDLARHLHSRRATPPPASLTPLDKWFRQLLEADFAFVPAFHRPLARRAQMLAANLFATTREVAPLHGDFHHDNVVGSTRGWRVIDPKGLIGDPHYEFANVFRNPYGAEDLAARPDRIERLADAIATRLGYERRRVLQWAAAHSAISAVWDHAAGHAFDSDLIMLPLLLAAADASS